MADTRYGTMPCPEPVVGDETRDVCGEPAEVFRLLDKTYKSVCPKKHVTYFGFQVLGAVEPI